MHPVELRLRSYIPDTELHAKIGKVVTDGDYNLLLTGPARVLRPDGRLLAVYLPGLLADTMTDLWPVLSGIRLITDNRGKASGTEREQRGDQKRTRTRRIMSGTVGAVDPGPSTGRTVGRMPVCRLTAWTGKHQPEWQRMHPLLQQIDAAFAEHVPDRYAVQARHAAATEPDWLVPDTVFTTVTVNNTYSTGVHQDAGDLEAGFSTLAVARQGSYRGGRLVLARYRVAVDMHHGDLLLFDAHEWHGNTAMWCACQPVDAGPDVQLWRPCPDCGAERVSLVAYYRTKVQQCESAEAEHAKAVAHAEGAGLSQRT